MIKKTLTINDIAKELNVSKTLVSLVLNDKGDSNAISKKTQQKVLDKARELKYKPNQVARGLRMGKTKTIGVIVADISNPFFAKITRAIERYAANDGYNIIVCSSDEDTDKENELLRTLINRQVDGIIMSSTQDNTEKIEQIISAKFPLVLFDRCFKTNVYSSVTVDNFNASKNAVRQFIEKGHTQIGIITLAPNYISPLRDRKNGFYKGLEQANITVNKEFILELDYKDVKEKQYHYINEFLSKNREMTAVFTTNNSLVVACMEVLKKLDRKIPDDLSLITFDDVELFRFTNPPLSSIAQPLEEIGKETVAIILEQMKKDKPISKNKILQTTLNIRQS